MARDTEPLERTGQRGFAHLGRAAAAEHVPAGHGLSREVRRDGTVPIEHLEAAHEAAVDPIFRREQRGPVDRDTPLRADRVAVTLVPQPGGGPLQALRAHPPSAYVRPP